MGNLIGTYFGSAVEVIRRSKRAIEEVDSDCDDDNLDSVMHRKKKCCLLSTTEYIYKTLFEDGRESDVSVEALEKKWDLHRVYLCQSPYFSSMFSGNWKESTDEVIKIEIMDDNITIESLNLALSSFYRDKIAVGAFDVVPLLATAILLQMDSVIEQCKKVMIETINVQTVINYHNTCKRYGITDVEEHCLCWLLQNLLTEVSERPATLRHISIETMRELVTSPKLYVMQTEFSIYVMLKEWTFLRLHAHWEGSNDQKMAESLRYFKDKNGMFLESAIGKEFSPVFQALRLVSLIYHYVDMEMIYADKILPLSWVQPAATLQWFHMLKVEQEKDKGPKDAPIELFDQHCTRCGRVIPVNTQHIWRWTGYNFGLDLVMIHDNSVLKIKRNHHNENLATINHHSRREIMFRVTVTSLNEQKQSVFTQSSGIRSISLAKNEELKIMTLGEGVRYPLLLGANFLITTPHTSSLGPLL